MSLADVQTALRTAFAGAFGPYPVGPFARGASVGRYRPLWNLWDCQTWASAVVGQVRKLEAARRHADDVEWAASSYCGTQYELAPTVFIKTAPPPSAAAPPLPEPAPQPTPEPEAALLHHWRRAARCSLPPRETEEAEIVRLMSQVTLPPLACLAAQGSPDLRSAAPYRPGNEVRLAVALESQQRLRAALCVWRVALQLARARWVLLAAGLRARDAGQVKAGQLAARATQRTADVRRRPRGGPGDQALDYGVVNLDTTIISRRPQHSLQSPVFRSHRGRNVGSAPMAAG
jgi:hypothetical protein